MTIIKRYVAVAVTALVAATSLAAAPAAAADQQRPAVFVDLGVHAGYGIFTVQQNYASQISTVVASKLSPGSTFSVGCTALLNVHRHVAVGTSVDVSTSAYNLNMTLVDSRSGMLNVYSAANRLYTLDIPVFARFSLDVAGDKVQWINESGLYCSMGLGGRSTISTYRSSTNSLGQSQVTHLTLKNDYYNDDNGLINRVVRTDVGLHFATGLMFNRCWELKGALRLGLRDVARNFGVYDTRLRNLAFTVTAGYYF